MISLRFVLVWVGLLATAVQAHDAPAWFSQTEVAPIAARYLVTIERVSNGKRREQPQTHTWYFYRNAEQVALLKGNVDEVWHRDAQQRISFERVFHQDARVVNYSTGELTALQVHVDWAALSRLIAPVELAQLKLVGRKGQGRDASLHLRGWIGQEHLDVDWLPTLALPQRLTRDVPGVFTMRMQLVKTAPTAPPHWPVVGQRSANYLHLDAADFGDMPHDPVVRQSQALDVRLGWRTSHHHE